MPTDLDHELRRIAAALVADPPSPPDWPLDDHILEQRPAGTRRVLVPTIAAATLTVVGVGGLWVASREPAGDPALGTAAGSPVPITVVTPTTVASADEAVGRPLLPSVFPAFGAPGPADDDAHAFYGGQTSWDDPTTTAALVARRTPDGFTDGVRIQAVAAAPDIPGTPHAVTAGGRPAQLFTSPDGSTLVIGPQTVDEPTLVVAGRDPVAFLDSGFEATTRAAVDGSTVDLTIDALPAGYDVIVAPIPMPRGAVTASLNLRAPDEEGDGTGVYVMLDDPTLGLIGVDVRAVDINGASGWQVSGPDGGPVVWPADDSTWALVGGFRDPDSAIEFARQVTFVDQATWQQRYGVDEPTFAGAPGTVQPTPAGADAVRVLPADVPDGLTVAALEIATMSSGDDVVERVYATTGTTPETAPSFMLTAVDARYASVDLPASAETVTVQGVEGERFSPSPNSQTIAFGPIAGTSYRVTGINMTPEQLLAAANTVGPAPDGLGGVLDTTVLPAGVAEVGVGTRTESTFFSRNVGAPMATMNWLDGDRTMWARVVPSDPAALIAGRLDSASVQDVTVQGHAGYVASGLPGSQAEGLTTIAWSDDSRTVFLYGRGVSADELLRAAESTRPVTAAEWDTLAASIPAPSASGAVATTVVISSTTD